MDKQSSENIVCTYCGEDAVKGTDPPVCEKHLEMAKKASEAPDSEEEKITWKELY